jgi:cellulose biosynthesis protein BcsQ
MIITVTSHKGGVGKTTTAIHLAAYLQRLAPTLLVDGDAIRSATKWSQRGGNTGLPFKVVTHAQLVNGATQGKTFYGFSRDFLSKLFAINCFQLEDPGTVFDLILVV